MTITSPSIKNHNQQSGFALVMVILVLLLVTVLAAELTFTVRAGTLEGFNMRQRLVGQALAHGGLNQAIFNLVDRPLKMGEQEPFLLGQDHETWLDTGRLTYNMVNESGKIDLNTAKRGLVRLLLEDLGMDEENQDILLDSLEDWRDADNLHRLQGAEDDYYQDLDDPYQPRNGKIVATSEILLVRGGDKLAEVIRIRDFFTVHNPGGKLNFNSLTPAMLRLLTDNNEERVTAYHELRSSQATLSAAEAQLVLGDEQFQQWSAFLSYKDNKVRFFTVTAIGYAGQKQEQEETGHRPGTMLTILFEKSGATIRYHSWQGEWS